MSLFEHLPEFPPALPNDELRLLSALPDWPSEQEVDEADHAAARRLERRKLIKISRTLDDPAGIVRTWYAGKLPTTAVRAAS